MLQVSIYGKGGIGKSTVSSNISYTLANKGMSVLQVGCDPKHDSTRALLDGLSQTTVLDYIGRTSPYDRKLEDIILIGKQGVRCVEAGGPEPGVGCAGRGILSTFDTLKKLGLDERDIDIGIYDVLGDVVCGGFAVPLREEYSDCVFLVTSGEFMSLYAANNILKGILNFDKGIPKVAGLIFNSRGQEEEKDIVERFAIATGLPIIQMIPRDERFSQAEANGITVSEMFPESDLAEHFDDIADTILSIKNGTFELKHPHPLDEEQMIALARGEKIDYSEIISGSSIKNISCRLSKERKETKEENILYFCATTGAVNGCFTVSDAVTLIHGPKSCAQIIMSGKCSNEIHKVFDVNDPPELQSRRVYCTCMDDKASVFGGTGLLEQKVRDLINEGKRNILVVTTCTSGIIGDDSQGVADRMMLEYPDIRVIIIGVDGNIMGDWGEGYIESAKALSQLIDGSVEPVDDHINLIAERYHHRQEENVDRELMELFELFGLKINCRFMHECDMDSIVNLKRGKRSFLFANDGSARGVAEVLSEHGIMTESMTLPSGINGIKEWVNRMTEEYGHHQEAEVFIARKESEYLRIIEECRKNSEGSKVIICQKLSYNVDWLLDLMEDLGVEVCSVLVARPRKNNGHIESKYNDRYNIITDLENDQVMNMVNGSDADFVLTDYNMGIDFDIPYTTYSGPGVGISRICRYAERFSRMPQQPARLGWRCR